MANRIQFLILTGDPGVGKTTLVKKLCTLMNENGIKTEGFYTEEIRSNGVREGFDVVTLDGKRGRLARDQNLLRRPLKCKVGKYGVLINEFEITTMPSIKKPEDTQTCLVIDEIGKMECFSEQFKLRIKEIFSPNSNYIVLATVPVRNSDSLMVSIKRNTKSKLWMVEKENRNSLCEVIFQELKTAFNKN